MNASDHDTVTTREPQRAGTPEALTAASAPHRRGRAGYAFVAPLLVVFSLFYLWPAFNTLLSSFFRWGLLRPWQITDPGSWEFVGLDNYVVTLANARFWNATVNTGIWLVLFPLLVTGVSLLIAIAIWHLPRGKALFRTVFILPMTISLAAAGVIWTLVYDPDFGTLPAVLSGLGLHVTIDWGPIQFQTARWLSDPGVLDLGLVRVNLVNLSLVIAGFWAFAGFGVITFTAGLSSIDEELIGAAKVDGARPHQVVRYVLIPALRGPLVIVATISVIFALRTFDIVWVITQGGPAQDSEVLAVLLWKQAFVFLDTPQAGTAAVIAIIMSVVLVALGWPYLRRLAAGGERG